MGLGPPVCEKCCVLAEYIDLFTSENRWECKYCGNKNPQWKEWDCGLREEELINNENFLNFLKVN